MTPHDRCVQAKLASRRLWADPFAELRAELQALTGWLGGGGWVAVVGRVVVGSGRSVARTRTNERCVVPPPALMSLIAAQCGEWVGGWVID